ncbi:3-methyl-2-oxobutanoate hydroxymethyltransferase [bacterium]|nr:3-methyl-2-oxobutanoate hydroxymethyltransferase [bacterium]
MKKVTIKTIQRMKQSEEKISALTAYDFLTAKILDRAGVDLILVGDSVGMVFSGYENTIPVTMDEMVYHTKAVSRGVERAFLVGDLPFMSYQISEIDAMKNAGRLLKEGGAEAVKLEGGEIVADTVWQMTQSGIPVMGHLGLTPQSVHQFGGFKTQAKSKQAADILKEDALILQDAGCFAIVLEKIPATLAKKVSESLEIPTIGIGAGVGCDGQILVTNDMLGMVDDLKPKFVREYANLSKDIEKAVKSYGNDVKNGKFPSEKQSF